MPAPDRITAALGLQTYQVIQFKRISKQRIEAWLWPRLPKWRCPRCLTTFDSYYDRRWRTIRDLDLSSHRTDLVVPVFRVECDRCGVVQVPIGIARPRARCTRRFEKWLFRLTRSMPTSEVAEMLAVAWRTVRDAEVRHILGLLRKRDLSGVTQLGIDEVSARKGHRYLTLVTDIKKRRVIWVGRGRDRAVIKSFFRWFGPERARRVRQVVIDMHDPYELELRVQCPRASIIYDHFHLVKGLNRALDNLRRRLQKELPPAGRKLLKGQRYNLLRASENLKSSQKVRLNELLAVNGPLSQAYVLKEDFRALLSEADPKLVRAELRDWKARVRESKIPEMIEFVKMLNRRRYGIQNFIRHRLANGLSEAFNNIVGTVKRVACGLRDFEYFRLKILRKCGGFETGH